MKLVIIENNYKLPTTVERAARDLKPTVTKTFTSFKACDMKEVYHALVWCDVVLIETTLIDKYQVDDMVALMSKIREPKQIVFTWEDTVKELFEYLENSDDIVKIAHHKIGHTAHYLEVEDGMEAGIKNCTLFAVNAIVVAERLRKAEEEKQAKLAAEKLYRDEAINRPTGQKVLIKEVIASGTAWSTLVFGSVVDALDMSELDTNPNRGIWVWGNGEPVKLLNESGYAEYEVQIDKSNKREIAVEVLKMAGFDEISENKIFSVMGFITDAMIGDQISTDLHYNLTAWLDDNNLPRRGLRTPIERYLCKMLEIN